MPINTSELDSLRASYKDAVEQWVAAIREEENLASADHSIIAMELWDAACFKEQDARQKAMEAKEQYKDALRQINYGI